MNSLTSLESILIIYLLVSYALGVVMIITAYYASKKVSDIIFIIWFGIALPITLPIVLYILIFDKWKRKRKQDLEKQFDDLIDEQENDIENGDLVACSVCGEYNKEEHMTRARFDYNEVVCPDCERDGN